MSLDVYLEVMKPTEVYSANITHNLNHMAEEAGIYKHLWRPDEIDITEAGQLIQPLTDAMMLLEADPARFKKHNDTNGWGVYEHFVLFVDNYLDACKKNPGAKVRVWR